MQPQTALFHSFLWLSSVPLGFPGDSVVKNTPANAGDHTEKPTHRNWRVAPTYHTKEKALEGTKTQHSKK